MRWRRLFGHPERSESASGVEGPRGPPRVMHWCYVILNRSSDFVGEALFFCHPERSESASGVKGHQRSSARNALVLRHSEPERSFVGEFLFFCHPERALRESERTQSF